MKILVFIINILFFTFELFAQTYISGDISGTWDPSGNPYIVTADCLVPNGQLLKINPGVTIIIGEDLNFNISGRIEAIGTAEQHIIFMAPNNSIYFNQIYERYYAGNDISKFEYCDISNARIGLYLEIAFKQQGTMITEIRNCKFTNCLEYGIYGVSHGLSDWNASHNTYLDPIIDNCIFNKTVNGATFYIIGYHAINQATSIGRASPIFRNNIFKDLTGTAFELTIGNNDVGDSYPEFINNTLVNCYRGVLAIDPYDAVIKNTIFFKTTIGVEKTGSLNNEVNYNCFFDNDSAYFIGYTSTYGDTLWFNNNGIPSDLLYNIFRDPNFADSIIYYLNAGLSPCIDAGDNSPGFNDICFPPSLGTEINDIGVTGGSEACNWILTNIDNNNGIIFPTKFLLQQNYPNPFNPTTKIKYEIPNAGFVSLKVYDVLGNELVTLVNQEKTAGSYEIEFEGSELTSGIYFYKLQAGDFVETKKMMFLK